MFYFIVNPHARSGQGINIWKKAEGFLAAEDTEYEVFFTKIHRTCQRTGQTDRRPLSSMYFDSFGRRTVL